MWVAGCPVQPILQLFHCHADAVADAGPQTDNCSEHVEFTLVGAPADAWLTITRRCPLFGWRRLFDARFAVSVRLGGKAEGRAIAGARPGPARRVRNRSTPVRWQLVSLPDVSQLCPRSSNERFSSAKAARWQRPRSQIHITTVGSDDDGDVPASWRTTLASTANTAAYHTVRWSNFALLRNVTASIRSLTTVRTG